ncbi:uncharacterized protein [Melanerpes formicivorus]|uniref:uncharacterized protein isoform X5 n=1 Tax=Melanerpes formicivorus TaxID=211600 RepID=UPI00358DE57C
MPACPGPRPRRRREGSARLQGHVYPSKHRAGSRRPPPGRKRRWAASPGGVGRGLGSARHGTGPPPAGNGGRTRCGGQGAHVAAPPGTAAAPCGARERPPVRTGSFRPSLRPQITARPQAAVRRRRREGSIAVMCILPGSPRRRVRAAAAEEALLPAALFPGGQARGSLCSWLQHLVRRDTGHAEGLR